MFCAYVVVYLIINFLISVFTLHMHWLCRILCVCSNCNVQNVRNRIAQSAPHVEADTDSIEINPFHSCPISISFSIYQIGWVHRSIATTNANLWFPNLWFILSCKLSLIITLTILIADWHSHAPNYFEMFHTPDSFISICERKCKSSVLIKNSQFAIIYATNCNFRRDCMAFIFTDAAN